MRTVLETFFSTLKSIVEIILAILLYKLIVEKTTHVLVIGCILVSLVIDIIVNIILHSSYFKVKEFNPNGIENIDDVREVDGSNQLLEKLIDDIMNYCVDVGIHPTIGNIENSAWILDVNDEEGTTSKVVELTLPEGSSFNEKHYDFFYTSIKDGIDKYINQKEEKV